MLPAAKPRQYTPLAFAVAAMFAAAAHAQTTSGAPSPEASGAPAQAAPPADGARDAAALKPVVVTATRTPAAVLGVPASVSVVDRQELRERNVVRIGDALADVPGLYIRGAAMGANFPGSGQAVLSLRGIPRTPRTLVMIDGQPINNALSGGVNVAGVPFEIIERAEIVRGPYSALYGGNAMGGVVNFITAGPDDPLTEFRLGAGSLSQRGASLVHRKRYESGLGVTLSLGWRESEGYNDSDYVIKRTASGTSGVPVTGAVATTTPDGQPRYWVGTMGARPWSQSTAQLAFHYTLSAGTKLTAGLGWAEYSVGYSRPDTFLRDAAGNPVFSGGALFNDGAPRRLAMAATDFFTPTPSGEQDLRAFVRAEHRFEGGSLLRANVGTLQHRFRFTQAAAGVATYDGGPGELTDQPNDRTDLDVSLRTPMSPRWALTGGVALNRSTMDRSTRALSSWRNWETTGAINTAGSGTSTNTALFVQSEHFLDHGVTAYLGGRFDRFETDGRVIDNGTPAFDQTYGKRSFQQFSPKVALVWEAQPWLSLRASYGEGFRPPALLDLYSRTVLPTATAGVSSVILPSPDLKPERVRSLDLGADVLVAGGGTASVTLYSQRLTDLIYRRTLDPAGTLSRNENAGAADVDGIEASVRWPTGLRGLKVFGAYTQHFRYEITRNDAAPATVGKVLTDVPRTTWSAGLELDRQPWSAFLVARHVSHVFGSGNDTNTNTIEGVYGSYDAYTVLSAKVAYRLDRNVTLSIAGDNLTNRQYFVFAKQPGRTVYGELAYRF